MTRKSRNDVADPSRRRLLAGLAAIGAASALPGCGNDHGNGTSPDALPTLPAPEDSGIDHIVQVMMENRSFDHMLGWVPGAQTMQQRVFRNAAGELVPTFPLAADPAYGFQGCGWADPAHGYDDGRVHLNNGAMDGFLLTEGTANDPDDRFPVGYYRREDLPFYAGVADHYTICDRYFHGILSSTFPNRIYIHAGATDRNNNTLPYAQQAPSTLPTIWDQLIARGISCANYFSDLPLTGLWGPKYLNITKPFNQFLIDAATGRLPAVSYFDPFFGASLGESPAGISQDDHPQADVRDGQAYLTRIYNALRNSPNWERTLMIVTYDEWGGFYDHVVPPFAGVAGVEAEFNDGRLGFRTPCVIIGPRARRGHVSHLQFDPNSVINLIRWRWGLDRVGESPRNETSLNMAYALDFDNPPDTSAPAFDSPEGRNGIPGLPFGMECHLPIGKGTGVERHPSLDGHQADWDALAQMCRRYGYIR
ncbi:alkaline phosphatase family protein [Fontimonas sp. SYSU GA230001]|uniref:alkaline phosphatase family protein n=1 Tax=Fontimonas sp. SYSU GA230001 TaxID=3142450 RepID=UPI0032B3730B